MPPSEPDGEKLRKIYLQAVEGQLAANEPPETRKTFDRLRVAGISEKDAKLLIASVIAVESYRILKEGKPFDHERFVRNLNKLPTQEFDEE